MSPATDPRLVRWYFDESLLGAAKILGRDRADIVHPGHPLVPDLPLGIIDTEWIPKVAAAGWVAFVRDRRIRTRPAEVAAFTESGLRLVWYGGKKDLSTKEQADLFLRHLSRLERELVTRGPGPWGLVLTGQGLGELRLRR